MNFIDKILVFLHLPLQDKTTHLSSIAYYAEIVFLAAILLLIINLIYKAKNRDQFFTGGTFLLLIIIPVSFIIFWACLKIPLTIEYFFPILRPHVG